MEYKNARTLEFKYYNDEKAKELEKALKANNIDFVSYYSVKSAKYTFIQT